MDNILDNIYKTLDSNGQSALKKHLEKHNIYQSLYYLARQYASGTKSYATDVIIKQDYKIAYKLYEISANNNCIYAIFELAQCYQYGKIGLDINIDKALELYKRSYEFSNYWGFIQMLEIYFEKKDDNSIIHLINKSIKQIDKFTLGKKIKEYLSNEYLTDLIERLIKLEEENETLRTELLYRPGGDGYIETMNDFNEKLKS